MYGTGILYAVGGFFETKRVGWYYINIYGLCGERLESLTAIEEKIFKMV